MQYISFNVYLVFALIFLWSYKKSCSDISVTSQVFTLEWWTRKLDQIKSYLRFLTTWSPTVRLSDGGEFRQLRSWCWCWQPADRSWLTDTKRTTWAPFRVASILGRENNRSLGWWLAGCNYTERSMKSCIVLVECCFAFSGLCWRDVSGCSISRERKMRGVISCTYDSIISHKHFGVI